MPSSLISGVNLNTEKPMSLRCVIVVFCSAAQATLHSARDQLQQSFAIQRLNPMTPLYRDVCNTLAVQLLNNGDNDYKNECGWSVGHYLAEAHSTTFRHSCLLNTVRKLRLVTVKVFICVLYMHPDISLLRCPRTHVTCRLLFKFSLIATAVLNIFSETCSQSYLYDMRLALVVLIQNVGQLFDNECKACYQS